MVSGTRCPYVSLCWCEVVRGAAAPKGPMTYAVFIALIELGYEPQGWEMGLEVGGGGTEEKEEEKIPV